MKSLMKRVSAAAVVAAVLAAGAFAQVSNCLGDPTGMTNCGDGTVLSPDTAYVPITVNVPAVVKVGIPLMTTVPCIGPDDGCDWDWIDSVIVRDTLRIPLNKTTGVAYGAQRRADGAPAIVSNRAGMVTLNLPAQSYKNAEVSLYSVKGKRVMRNKISAASASNGITRRNVAAGAYLLSVKGADGAAATSRLTHRGGNLDIKVVFGGENLPRSASRLAKRTDKSDCPEGEECNDIYDGKLFSVSVRPLFLNFTDTTFSFIAYPGLNEQWNINLHELACPKCDANVVLFPNITAQPLMAPSRVDNAAKTAAVGANDFAFQLGAKLGAKSAESAPGQNFVFSPYSVWLPLAALVNATKDEYKDALLTALGASGITQNDINRAASRMLYSLTTKPNYADNPGTLKIANAIFVDKKVTLRTDFAQAFMDFYRGSAISVDFKSKSAVDAVNKWASDNTDSLITEVIKNFDDSTVAAIANAIYFSDRWGSEFDTNKTTEGDFQAPAGNTRVRYMQREGRNQSYYEDDRAQAVSLPFAQGGGLCIILPKAGAGSVKELYASMTNSDFVEIRKSMKLSEGKLKLPRFSIDNDVKYLTESLKALGVPLFDIRNNPLAKLIRENMDLAITSVAQKAVIKVDEKGTTAAAVTVMSVAGITSVPPPQPYFEMVCDRPFMFVLYDRTYDGGDQILFTGVVNKP